MTSSFDYLKLLLVLPASIGVLIFSSVSSLWYHCSSGLSGHLHTEPGATASCKHLILTLSFSILIFWPGHSSLFYLTRTMPYFQYYRFWNCCHWVTDFVAGASFDFAVIKNLSLQEDFLMICFTFWIFSVLCIYFTFPLHSKWCPSSTS